MSIGTKLAVVGISALLVSGGGVLVWNYSQPVQEKSAAEAAQSASPELPGQPLSAKQEPEISKEEVEKFITFLDHLDSLDKKSGLRGAEENTQSVSSQTEHDDNELVEKTGDKGEDKSAGALKVIDPERERLIAEIEERIAVLSQERAEIQAERDALPPPLILGPDGRVLREDLEKDMAVGARRFELDKQSDGLYKQITELRKQLKELRNGT